MIRVVLAGDRDFVRPLGVAVSSLLESRAGAPPEIDLLLHGVGAEDVERFRALAARHGAALRVVEIDVRRVDGLPRGKRFGIGTYFRLLMPELVDAPRVLYLDGDVLVERDLGPLWETDLAGAALAALPNLQEQDRRHRTLGLSPTHDYFNAGVMLADLEAWRRERVTERTLDFLRREGTRAMFLDQDALNVALQDRARSLSCVWNFMPYLSETRFQEDYHAIEFGSLMPAILHFAGPVKPWRPQEIEDRYVRRWREACLRSPWGVELSGPPESASHAPQAPRSP